MSSCNEAVATFTFLSFDLVLDLAKVTVDIVTLQILMNEQGTEDWVTNLTNNKSNQIVIEIF